MKLRPTTGSANLGCKAMWRGESLDNLTLYSRKWGRDPELVQAGGGNTSLKSGETLHVKASGFRLGDAMTRNIFVGVERSQVLADGWAPAAHGLRPSIETLLHAVMPHPVVAHLHMVQALAFAVRRDAPAALAPRLSGLNWSFVPYRKPGAALAKAVADVFSRDRPDLIVLGNHGVLVGADSCAEADVLIEETRRRLAVPPRGKREPRPSLHDLARRLGLEVVRSPGAHLAASNPLNLAYATAGTLYPDHLVFLGPGARQIEPNTGELPPGGGRLFLVPSGGALVHRGASQSVHEMAGCLGEVVSRIAPDVHLSALTLAEEAELVDWDAEAYRQAVAT